MLFLRCYPKITDWIYFMSGQSASFDYRFLPLYSFGFFVALAFLGAATVSVIELRRREKLGLLKGMEKEITEGQAPATSELVFYAVFGFVLGFKLVGMHTYHEELSTGVISLGDYMLSITYGSWIGGILAAAGFAYYYYYSTNKKKLPEPVKKKILVYPSDSMGDLVVMGAILGVLGSNLFNYFEDPGDYSNFWADPAGSLFSGLSIYGGLICASIGFIIYAYIRKINLLHFLDSLAPGVILANGIGRLGCQTAGDGDWGIANLHPKPDWIPQFLWSSHFEHNIINENPQNVIPGCMEEHCNYLANPVYPTSIYEFLMCFAIFVLLWVLCKRFTYKPGIILALFMIFISIERLSIERLRDISGRAPYNIFGVTLRQSELISIILIISGTILAGWLLNKYKRQKQQPV